MNGQLHPSAEGENTFRKGGVLQLAPVTIICWAPSNPNSFRSR